MYPVRSLFLSFLIVLGLAACHNPYLPFTPGDVKRHALKRFPSLKDTSEIGVVYVSENKHNHWYVAFNKVPVAPYPKVYLYHAENPEEAAHEIRLEHEGMASIEHIYFEDVTYNGEYELLLELHHDYDLAYQSRELLIFQHPFDTAGHAREIFSFPFEQVREKIIDFDEKYGTPIHEKQIENHASLEFFEGLIFIRGTVNHHRNHLVEYRWDKKQQRFVLELDEDLHEAEEEETQHEHVHKVRGSKILMVVNSHEEGCKSYLLEDDLGHILDVDKEIHDALLCSPVTSLSKGGRYLVYTDHKAGQLHLYDFKTAEYHTLLKHLHTYEGISDIIWSSSRYRRMAFIAINPEEYEENTRIFIFELTHEGILKKKMYNLRVLYDCESEEACLPVKDYDYWFSSSGDFIYRSDNTGNQFADFSHIKLEESR